MQDQRCVSVSITYCRNAYILQVPGVETLSAVKGPVYVKYNAGSRSSYVSGYSGGDRGVLLSMGQIQIGHLPLGLFDEAKASPAVEI
jgi:hypothetical protein